ncbi:hypothetical protein GC177_09440 [bacterium]|nr:hypothetical protein [bacterium]
MNQEQLDLLAEKIKADYKRDLMAGVHNLVHRYEQHHAGMLTGDISHRDICHWLETLHQGGTMPDQNEAPPYFRHEDLRYFTEEGLAAMVESFFAELDDAWLQAFRHGHLEGHYLRGYLKGTPAETVTYYEKLADQLMERHLITLPDMELPEPGRIYHISAPRMPSAYGPGYIWNVYYQLVPERGLYALYADVGGQLNEQSVWTPVSPADYGNLSPLMAGIYGMGDRNHCQAVEEDVAQALNAHLFKPDLNISQLLPRAAMFSNAEIVTHDAPMAINRAAEQFLLHQQGYRSQLEPIYLMQLAADTYRLVLDEDLAAADDLDALADFLVSSFGYHAEVVQDDDRSLHVNVTGTADELARAADLVTFYCSLDDLLLNHTISHVAEDIFPPEDVTLSEDDIKEQELNLLKQLKNIPDQENRTPLGLLFTPYPLLQPRFLLDPLFTEEVLATLCTGSADSDHLDAWNAYITQYPWEKEPYVALLQGIKAEFNGLHLIFRTGPGGSLTVDLRASPPVDNTREHELRLMLGRYLGMIGWLENSLTMSPYTGEVERLNRPFNLKAHWENLPLQRHLQDKWGDELAAEDKAATADIPITPIRTPSKTDLSLLEHIANTLKRDSGAPILDIIQQYEHTPAINGVFPAS